MHARLQPWLPVLLAAVLALAWLDAWPLWQDEAFTWEVVQRPFAGIVEGAAKDRHPPLYYLLVAPVARISNSDLALRLPSALFVVAAVALTTWTARRHLDPVPAGLASWVMAMGPYAALYAHTARMYALLILAGAAVLAGSLEVVRGPRPGGGAVVLGVGAAVAMWTHYAGFAGVVGGALAVGLGAWPAPDRKRRWALGLAALALAALAFAPWLSTLRVQLATKDQPAARTWEVLRYATWAFDSRIPWFNVLLGAAQAWGVLVAARRRDPLGLVAVGWTFAALVMPWYASRSEPAQNARNYADFLAFGSLAAGLGLADAVGRIPRWPRLATVPGLAALAALPLADMYGRPGSPQETGAGFNYRVEASFLDQVIPADDPLLTRPAYLIRQYSRYRPGLDARTLKATRPGVPPWLILARGERLEAALSSMYRTDCQVTVAFKYLVVAPDAAGCAALFAGIAQVGTERGYVPFLMELATRALAAKDAVRAAELAGRAARELVGHPAAWAMVAQAEAARAQFPAAAAAAEEALAIATAWHFPGPVIGEMHDRRAAALRAMGDTDRADAAQAAARCAREAAWPTWCGNPLYRYGRLGLAKVLPPPAPASAPAASPSPPRAPAAPVATPTATPSPPSGGGTAPAGTLSWSFDDVAAASAWIEVAATSGGSPRQVALDTGGAFQLGSSAAGTTIACGPMFPAAGPTEVAVRWASAIPGKGYVNLELRPIDGAGQVLKEGDAPIITAVATTAGAHDWREARGTWTPAPGAERGRACLKVVTESGGAAWLDWVVVGPA